MLFEFDVYVDKTLVDTVSFYDRLRPSIAQVRDKVRAEFSNISNKHVDVKASKYLKVE